MAMRRLLILASLVVFVDTLFFAAIVPLLPGLSDEFDLTKTAAGLLSGSYAVGTLVAAIPAGFLAARIGAKKTTLIGLGVMTVTVLVFAFASSPALLTSSRFLQGAAGACSWAGALSWMVSAAPRERRGELIGSAMAAAIAGVLMGPAVGALADIVSRAAVFSGVGVLGIGLAAFALRIPAPPSVGTADMRSLVAAMRSTPVRFGFILILVPGMIFGAIDVLVPLELDALGATAVGIAGVFLASAGFEAVVAPLAGRVSDRRGRFLPCAAGLVASVITMLLIQLPTTAIMLGAVVILAAPGIGMLWSPAMAMLSDGAEASGVNLGLAFGFTNLGWGVGHAIGGVAGPTVADSGGNDLTYSCLAVLSGLVLIA
ncbi:MAG TPA: MFS transporter, partial [Solirubrobacterales bacterium]|nr:MFS transporter [Solirubrobacterales bacterium]